MTATATLTKTKHVSKSEKISKMIKADIASGKYVHQLPGVTVLAKELGVNPLTVNKAFEQLENEGFVERVSRKGTFIKSKKRIGLINYQSQVSPRDGNYHKRFELPRFLTGVWEGMHEAVSEHSYTMLTHSLFEDNIDEIENIIEEVDGLIIFCSAGTQNNFDVFNKVPWIKVMGTIDEPKDANHITYNNDEIGVIAADYLINKSCERFYYFGGLNNLFSPRYENFYNTLAKNNKKGDIIELDYAKLKLDVLVPKAKEIFNKIFSGDYPRTGLFLSSSSYLSITYQLLYFMGITPMQDVEIITCENIPQLLYGLLPQPAVIDLRMQEIGKRGVEMLVELQRNHKNTSPGVYEKMIFSPKLIEPKQQ
jgi:DNA-binding LacI/PurR family transcriptional regulator